MGQIFKPTLAQRRIKMIQIIVWIGLGALLILIGIKVEIGAVLLLCLWPIVFVALASNLYQLQATWVTMDEQRLQARIGRQYYRIRWADILVAQLKFNGIELLTVDSEYLISFPVLSNKEVWEQACCYIPVEARFPDAYKQLPSYRKWVAERKGMLLDNNIRLVVGFPRYIQGLLWLVCIALIAGIGYLFLSYTSYWWLIIFIMPTVLGSVIAAATSMWQLQMTAYTITSTRFWKTDEIQWDEVWKIRLDRFGYRLIFFGRNEILYCPGIKAWVGRDHQRMLMFLNGQIQQRKIIAHKYEFFSLEESRDYIRS